MRSGSGGGGGSLPSVVVRYFSRKAAVNVRKINPKVPHEDAFSIAHSLYHILKHQGPLTVSNTWLLAKDAGICGLNSKTHMKIMLKWMRGRKMLKLFCNQVGSNKKFLHCTLPEDPEQPQSSLESEQQKTKKPPIKGKKR
ncbi:hypothetical protein CFOL_v3_18607, partial [Cephalotus follicularis]